MTARKPRAPKPPPLDTDVELDGLLAEMVPDVIDPGYDAHLLRVAGVPWAEIATKIGSPNGQAAMRLVSSYLQKAAAAMSSSQQQEALQTQIDRYETILASWWQQATTFRDEKAAGVVLRAMERLDRIMRLTEGDVVVTKETLVVSANPEQYIKQLQDVVANRSK